MDTNITLLAVFVAGILSFFSPCVLPLVPTYIVVLSGGDADPKARRLLLHSLCFYFGFATVFVTLGATASYIGVMLSEYQDIIRRVGALVVFVMGLQLIGLLRINFFAREYRPLLAYSVGGPIGAFILGIAFTVGWTPCTGPILAAILAYAGVGATVNEGAFLLFIYSLGFFMPFFLMTVVWGRYIVQLRKIHAYLPLLQKISGILLLILSIMLYFDWMQWVLGIFLDNFGTRQD